MTAFREGRKDVLVATDVASKGLDFPNIAHVINYDMPEDIENYGMKILDLSGHLIKDKSNNLRINCLYYRSPQLTCILNPSSYHHMI